MVAITDKFGKASVDDDYAVATTVKTARSVGVTVLEAYDLSKFADDTPVFVVTYKKSTDPVTGVVSVTGLVSWKALVNASANTLTNLTLAPGYVDAGNDEDDFIECIPTSYWENELINGLFVGHNPDGSFKDTMPFTSLTANLLEGWIYDVNTWVYVSGTGTTTGVFKISGIDATDYLQVGMPFKIVQGGVTKYGFITKVAFSTDTTVTCFMAATNGTVDNSGIANATITTPAFGKPKQPGFGFPLDPNKWTVSVINTTNKDFTTASLVSSTITLSVPIGAWTIYLNGQLKLNSNGTSGKSAHITVSTDGSTETNPELSALITEQSVSILIGATILLRDSVIFAAATTLTILGRVTSTTNSPTATLSGAAKRTKLQAVCAYL